LTCAFLTTLPNDGAHREPKQEFDEALRVFRKDAKAFETAIKDLPSPKEHETPKALRTATVKSAPIAETSRDLAKQADHVFKLLGRLLDTCEKDLEAKENEDWNNRDINRARKTCEEARHALVEQLREVRYFHRQAVWLVERFRLFALLRREDLTDVASDCYDREATRRGPRDLSESAGVEVERRPRVRPPTRVPLLQAKVRPVSRDELWQSANRTFVRTFQDAEHEPAYYR
jgi:hypothetical protein